MEETNCVAQRENLNKLVSSVRFLTLENCAFLDNFIRTKTMLSCFTLIRSKTYFTYHLDSYLEFVLPKSFFHSQVGVAGRLDG